MGSNDKRPKLTSRTSVDDFRNFYWYKEELTKFCVEHGLPVYGMKHELTGRIESFLKTGKIPANVNSKKATSEIKRTGPLTLETVVDDTYRCNSETRQFFKNVIGPHFHFTAHLQAYLKANIQHGLSYGDLAKEWQAEFERRKDKNYKAPILKTWEYNQFTRDYLSDKANKGKTIKDAAAAWKKIRVTKGARTYAEYKKKYGKI